MMDENPELKNVKAMLRSTLISVKEGVPAASLNRDYQEIVGAPIPFRKFGFSSLEDFIISIPDVVRIQRRGPEFILHAVADDSTSHIKDLVSKQRSKKVKKPARRLRGGGGGGRFMRRPMGPGRPGPGRGGMQNMPVHSRHGIPTFISPPQRKPLTSVMISVGNTTGARRTISVGNNPMLNRAMLEANRDSIMQRSLQLPTNKFEVPPRFRNRLGQKSPPQQKQHQRPIQTTPLRRTAQQTLSTMADGDVYISKLSQFLREKQIPMKFDTTPAAGGYVSSITINKQTYGSGDIFRSAKEAEAAAAQNACNSLNLDRPQQQESSMPLVDWNNTEGYNPVVNWAEEMTKEETGGTSHPPGQLMKVKARVKEILHNKKNGLWGTRIPFEYKERYKEEPPGDLMVLVKSWKDIAKVEFVPNTDRDIVYPVQDDENKNLKIPCELLITSEEGDTVYMTYVRSPSYFCVQREDSCINEITEALQTHCKGSSAPPAEQLEPGRYCAGLYSGDGCWTRAEILQNKQNGTVELLFVDYGNVELTKVKDVRWLSPDTAKQPAQATSCTLYGVQPLQGESGWSDAASEMFADMVGEEQALIAIPRNVFDNMVEVSLYQKSDPNKSISQKLAEARVVQLLQVVDDDDDDLHPVDLVFPEDKEWDVHVTYISATTESVMVRLVGDEFSEKLDNFQAKLQEAFHNSCQEGPILQDRTYIAYDDGLYHRVRVISQDEKKVECYFLDHGDTDELLSEQLRPIDPVINKLLPYQAVEVSLYGLEEVSNNITALEKICDLALGKTVVAEVMERNDIPSVILYDTSGDSDLNINETILRTIEAEGGGIGSSSSTPKRVLSPAISSSDVPSSANIQQTSASDTKSKLDDLTSGTNEMLPGGVNTQVTAVKNDQNDNPVYSKPNVDGAALMNNLVDKLQISKIYEDKISPSLLKASPTKQESDSDQLKNQSANTVVNSSSPSQSVSRPILGRSPGASSTKVAGSLPANFTETHPKPFEIPPVGSFLDVHINFIHDPSHFVCMPFHEMNNLNQLLLDMLDYYKAPLKTLTKPDIEKGKVYAGYKDEVWYRVRVSEFVGTDLVTVYLIDIGEFSVMMISELQPLVDQFRILPAMAITATLGSITPVSGIWYEAAKYLFIELAREKDLVGLVQGRDPDTGIVNFRLIDTSSDEVDLCIDEVLVKKEFAKHVDT